MCFSARQVAKIVRLVKVECGVEDDSVLFRVFEDAGFYRQHTISERDFIRVMAQFDFAGSSMAKYVISELQRQLDEMRGEAARDRRRRAKSEETILHLQKRVAELEQTLQWKAEFLARAAAAKDLSESIRQVSVLQEERDAAGAADHSVVLKNIVHQLSVLSQGPEGLSSAKTAVRLLETEHRLDEGWRRELGGGASRDSVQEHAYQLLIQWSTERTNRDLFACMTKAEQALRATQDMRKCLESEAKEAEATAQTLRNEVAALKQAGGDEPRMQAAAREELVLRQSSAGRREKLAEANRRLAALARVLFLIREATATRIASCVRVDDASAAAHALVRRTLRWTALACANVTSATGGDLFACPPLAILVPVPERTKVLVDLPKADIQYEWFGDTPEAYEKRVDPFSGKEVLEKSSGDMNLHFLCACDLSAVGGPGIRISGARAWTPKVAPALRWTLLLLKEAILHRSEGSALPRLPIPVRSSDPQSMLEMIDVMLAVYVDPDHQNKEQRTTADLAAIANKAMVHQSAAEEEAIIRTLQYRMSDALFELSGTVAKLDPQQESFLQHMSFAPASDGKVGYWVAKANEERWQRHCAAFDSLHRTASSS